MSALRAAVGLRSAPSEPVALADVVEGPPELLGCQAARPARVASCGVHWATSPSTGWSPATPSASWRPALTVTRHYGRHGEARGRDVAVFIESFAPPPAMIIFGAVDFTAALARVAKVLGYRVTVCDARPVFATRARFPMADEVVVDWPDRYLAKVGASLGPRDAVCVLTHDPKFDVPAIVAALPTTGRLPRGDGLAADPRRAAGAAARGGRRRRRLWPG